ncbi:MAG: L-rhamnose/proton symporter RhaT [Kiritimatiellae bacterium]|nr:L-rhamnose/proton symporter RhaT [Kiritimatiellia bacterium]
MEHFLGILLLLAGGFSAASFYVPSHAIKKWTWETYWISLGFVAWVIMPPLSGLLTTPDLWAILRSSPAKSALGAYGFGVLWGFGGFMSALGLRYLGISLGQSVCLGVCAIVGTLVPAAIDGKIVLLFTTGAGLVVLMGFLVCLAGTALCGYAGVRKEQMLSDDLKKAGVKEFALVKGLTLAVAGGVMSASIAFAFTVGAPIAGVAVDYGTAEVFKNMPLLVFALLGGFTTNLISTMITTAKNKAFGDYVMRPRKILLFNYLLAIVSGILWYGQWFSFGTGATKLGEYSYAGWSIFMAAIIIFSNLWGVVLKEWRGVDAKTRVYLWTGISVLVVSVIMIGIGDGLAGR